MERVVRGLIKTALLEKNKDMQVTYKNILETAQKEAKKSNVPVTDDMIVRAIKTEISQLEELKSYCMDSSEQLAVVERKIGYCNDVLPKMATEDEIRDYLTNNKIEKNMGKAMTALKAKFGTCMDNRMASTVAKAYISG